MSRRGSLGGRVLAALSVLALLPGCQKKEPAPPPAVSADPVKPLAPWSWHKLGGLLVVVGEVDQPTDLILKGRYLDEKMHAEFGPVRWEMYAPPPSEIAELRTLDGKLLARWEFTPPVPKPTEKLKPAKPVPPKVMAKKAAPAKPTKPIVAQTKPSLPAAPPAVRTPPPAPVQPEVKQVTLRPWPETHLPMVQGPTPKRPKVRKPAPMIAKATPVSPQPPAAPPTPRAARIPLEVPARPVPDPKPVPDLKPLPMVTPGLPGEWPGAGEAINLARGPRGSHWVCLTFDGGSTSEVALDVLDALQERGIRTTFFLTGAFIQKYPDLVRRMDRDGHEIGNHTMDHPHLAPGGRRDPRWTKERFQQQLLLADSLLLKLLGHPMDPYWRAPYGENTAELRKWAEELGYRHVYWSEGADTLDWATIKERRLYRTGNAILDRLYSRMEKDDGDGLIVLMHLGSGRPEGDRPARVLGPFLDKALEEGWNFVNIGAYLKESGKPRWNSSHRLAMLGGASLGQTAPRQ